MLLFHSCTLRSAYPTRRCLRRLTRLEKQRTCRFSTTKSNQIVNVENIRNAGLIAHIDAGKTTVTERLLYLGGRTKSIGGVDTGNTITDFMDMERERGITIQAAAVSLNYANHRMTLIDTPGHAEFAVEVERSLRVLDGAVIVLDGSAGVQAQTLSVWQKAEKYDLPRVYFINKMDKFNANYSKSMQSIENMLKTPVAALVVPFASSADAKIDGFVNLLTGKQITFENTSKEANWRTIEANSPSAEHLLRGREELYSKIAEYNDKFATIFLQCERYSDLKIEDALPALKECVNTRKLAPGACGSALRLTQSVQPLLDLIINYIPYPAPASHDTLPSDVEQCGFIFKVSHDKRLGPLFFTRVYRGTLTASSSLTINNANGAHLLDAPIKLFAPFSDELEARAEVREGEIAVLAGLRGAVTGDTLLDAKFGEKQPEHENFYLHTIDVPEPVFYCSIEPPNLGATTRLENALGELCVEDPSYRMRRVKETNQTIIEMQGELHAEVLKNRLLNEYNLDVFLGPQQITYREVAEEAAEHTHTVRDTFGESREQQCTLTLRVVPGEVKEKFKSILLDIRDDETPAIRKEWLKAINEGCKNALFNGPILGSPVQGVDVFLTEFSISGSRIRPSLLSACAYETLIGALQNAGTYLIEPVMRLEIQLHHDAKGVQVTSSAVLSELTKRRAIITESQEENPDTHALKIGAIIPLAETQGLARAIRSSSAGYATFSMHVHDYRRVAVNEVAHSHG